MKKLAVITNELFKDYLKIVSTEDLDKTLDNPDVPIPYECLNSVENTNSDALAEQLATFFSQSKIPNKDFYKLNEENVGQLEFMMNLIKLSSNGSVRQSAIVSRRPLPITEPITVEEVVPVPEIETVQSVEEVTPVVTTTVAEPVILEPTLVFEEPKIPFEQLIASTTESNKLPEISEVSSIEDDPFLKTQEVKVIESIPNPVLEDSKVESIELIPTFNIPKNSIIHLAKKDSITATLVDENNAIFEGVTMNLTDAAKAALKKAGMFGVSTGNIAWLYNGVALKDLT